MNESKYIEYLKRNYESLRNKTGDYILEGDQIAEDEKVDSKNRSLKKFEFTKIHNNLIPQPVFGNIKEAKIVICSFNPGFDEENDYKVEDEQMANEARLIYYKDIFLSQLNCESKSHPFIGEKKSNDYNVSPGANWWRKRLNQSEAKKSLVQNIKNSYKNNGIEKNDEEIFDILARNIASIELFPYHTKNKVGKGTLESCKSVEMIKNFVYKELIPNAKVENRIICFTRSISEWEVENNSNVIDEEVVFINPEEYRENLYYNVELPLGSYVYQHLYKLSKGFTKEI